MKQLYRLPGTLLLLALMQLTCCIPIRHTAQAPPRTRRDYHQAERRHSRERHRHRPNPLTLPWN